MIKNMGKKMKFLYIVVSLFTCGHVFAATLLTSCPSGYTTLHEQTIYLTAGTSCPSGYAVSTTLGPACISGSSNLAACWLVSLTDTDYSDTSGTYQFTQPCPYENSGSVGS